MPECGGVRYPIDSIGRVEVKTEDQSAEHVGRMKVLKKGININFHEYFKRRKSKKKKKRKEKTYLDRKPSVILSVAATSKKSRDSPGEVSDLGKIMNDNTEWRGAQLRILQIWGIMISCTLNR